MMVREREKEEHRSALRGSKRRGGEKENFVTLACEPRIPYLSFPDAYVLLGPGCAVVQLRYTR
jgi:hypothetical protein